jgi:hypothetical protein
MRHSLLSRSAIAVASLAVGSAALAAVPAAAAPAASSLGITQAQVLTAVDSARAYTPNGTQLTKSAERAIFTMISKVCDVDGAQGEYANLQDFAVTNAGDDATGLWITAQVYGSGFAPSTACTFAAFTSTAPGYQLSGSASVTAKSTIGSTTTPIKQDTALSGDVFTTPAIVTPYYSGGGQPNNGQAYDIVASASGNATKTTKVTTSSKVKDKKTTSEKKAAKKKYSKRLAQAKKNYAKALDKAGSSKSKKAAAKRVYAKARALAKAKYKYATAGYKIVKKSSNVSDVRAFSITTPPVQAPPVIIQN